MRAKVDLHDIVLLEHSEIPRIRCIVSCYVIDAASSGKSYPALNLVCLDQSSIGILNLIANVYEAHPRLDDSLCVLSDLSVSLGRLTKGLVIVSEESFFLAVFGAGRALSVFILVLTNLTLGIDTVGELLSDSDHGWGRLLVRCLAFSFPVS